LLCVGFLGAFIRICFFMRRARCVNAMGYAVNIAIFACLACDWGDLVSMDTVVRTSNVDVSGIRQAMPLIVSFGRRTLREQCVTSAAFICLDAQQNTAAVEVGAIDAELQVEVTGYTKTGRKSRAKNPRVRRVTTQSIGKKTPLAVLLVMARTNPQSAYSLSTGNRWPLDAGQLPRGKGSMTARMAMINQWISRMTLSRHSSTHFLQHGWAAPIRTLLSDPAYYAGRSKMQIRGQSKINPSNTLGHSDLGMAVVSVSGDACLVMAENAIGEGGNPVLDANHRAALIQQGAPPLQAAIDKEANSILTKIQEYLDRGMKQELPQFQ
jgi:hypothetical protein